MTRNAWATVRLPGARTAPATRIRTCRQTGAAKHGRKIDSHAARTDAARGGAGGATAPGQFTFIAALEPAAPQAFLHPRRRKRSGQGIVADGRSDHSTYRDVPLSSWGVARRAAQPRLRFMSCRIRSAGRTASAGWAGRRVGRTIVSKFSIARFGNSDGHAPGRSDAQLCQSIAPSRSSPPRTSSGSPHSPAQDRNCGKSS